MPDPKDSEAVRKHINAKYKDKRFAVKDPEKVTTGTNKPETKKTGKETSDDSGSESEEEKPKTKQPAKKEEKKEVIPSQVKLAPLSMKSSGNNNNANGPNIKQPSKTDNGWANFPSSADKNTGNAGNAGNAGFTFFDTPKTEQNFDNAFTFVDSKPKENKVGNDWGIVWDNSTTNNISPNKENKVPVQGGFDFSFVQTPVTNNHNSNNNHNHTNNNNNSIPIINTTFPPKLNANNANLLSQNLNSVYTEPKQQRKSLDDLERALGDPSIITPFSNNTTSNNTNFTNMNQTNMMGVSNNMFMMNPQMMQQMQMMMNPQMMQQMQSNPQMMQMFMMMQNMMAGGMQGGMQGGQGMNNMSNMSSMNTMNTMSNMSHPPTTNQSLNELNFGNMSLKDTNLPKENSKEEEVQKYDVFKDIYNYSKTSTAPRQSINKDVILTLFR